MPLMCAREKAAHAAHNVGQELFFLLLTAIHLQSGGKSKWITHHGCSATSILFCRDLFRPSALHSPPGVPMSFLDPLISSKRPPFFPTESNNNNSPVQSYTQDALLDPLHPPHLSEGPPRSPCDVILHEQQLIDRKWWQQSVGNEKCFSPVACDVFQSFVSSSFPPLFKTRLSLIIVSRLKPFASHCLWHAFCCCGALKRCL